MMTKITRISKTRRGRFALFSEDDFLFSLDAETFVYSNLQEGSTLTEEEFSTLRANSDIRKAKDQALRYLSLRAYGQQELYTKLLLKYDEHTSAAAIASMQELSLLDDETFAREKAKGLASRGKGSADIRRRLQQLGLADATVQNALADAQIDDTAAALAVLQKAYLDKLRRGETQKVMAALARRGFSHSTICRVVQTTSEQFEEDI